MHLLSSSAEKDARSTHSGKRQLLKSLRRKIVPRKQRRAARRADNFAAGVLQPDVANGQSDVTVVADAWCELTHKCSCIESSKTLAVRMWVWVEQSLSIACQHGATWCEVAVRLSDCNLSCQTQPLH